MKLVSVEARALAANAVAVDVVRAAAKLLHSEYFILHSIETRDRGWVGNGVHKGLTFLRCVTLDMG